MVTGLTANTRPLDVLLGVDSGQSTVIVRKLPAGVPHLKVQGDIAFWSLSATYYMESGILTAVAMLIVFMMILRAVMRSSARLIVLVSLGIWIIGVTVTTSYPHLSSI